MCEPISTKKEEGRIDSTYKGIQQEKPVALTCVFKDQNAVSSEKKFERGPTSKDFCEKAKKQHICTVCHLKLSHRQSLYRHRRKKHPLSKFDNQTKATLACPECPNFYAFTIKQLIQHLNENHDKKFQILSKRFFSIEAFKSWKREIERETSSLFRIRRGKDVCNDFYRTLYHCHRSGVHQSKTIKRGPKAQGSCKSGMTCTAFMTTKTFKTNEGSETVLVEYCLSHVGHGFEPKHLRMSDDLKTCVVKKLSQGLEPHDILDSVREETFPSKRDSLLTIKDIYNIRRRHNIFLPVNKKKPYTCSLCSLQCKSQFGLRVHQRKKHSMASNRDVLTKCSDVDDVSDDIAINEHGTACSDLKSAVLQEGSLEVSRDPGQLKASIMRKLNDFEQLATKTDSITVLNKINNSLANAYKVFSGHIEESS